MLTDTEKLQILNHYIKTMIQSMEPVKDTQPDLRPLFDSFCAIDVIITGIINATTKESLISYLTSLEQKLAQEGFRTR